MIARSNISVQIPAALGLPPRRTGLLRDAQKLYHRGASFSYPTIADGPGHQQRRSMGLNAYSSNLPDDHPCTRNDAGHLARPAGLQLPCDFLYRLKLSVEAFYQLKNSVLPLYIGQIADESICNASHVRLGPMKQRSKTNECYVTCARFLPAAITDIASRYPQGASCGHEGGDSASPSSYGSDRTPVEMASRAGNAGNHDSGGIHQKQLLSRGEHSAMRSGTCTAPATIATVKPPHRLRTKLREEW
ncbi:hypothetical protein V8017_12990 [Stenotrophomonas rhizophila]